MTTQLSTRRLPGGRMPTQSAISAYFFGPLLVAELDRYSYAVTEAAQEGALDPGSEVKGARLSISQLTELCRIRLPAMFTVPYPKASLRNSDGSFECEFARKLFSRFSHSFAGAGDMIWPRLRNSIVNEDYLVMWQELFNRNFGANYHFLPTFKQLMSNMATIAAGIEIFLYDQMAGEGRSILTESPKIFNELDGTALESFSVRAGVSPGVVMAAAVLLAGRKRSPAIRTALQSGNWDPVHEALWAPIFPQYKSSPYFLMFLEKLQDPSKQRGVGRPINMPIANPGAGSEKKIRASTKTAPTTTAPEGDPKPGSELAPVPANSDSRKAASSTPVIPEPQQKSMAEPIPAPQLESVQLPLAGVPQTLSTKTKSPYSKNQSL